MNNIIKKPRKTGSIGHITLDQIHQLLNTIDKRKYNLRNTQRDKILIESLVDSCLRISELLNVTPVDIKNQEIRVLGKGSKYRTIAISKQMAQKLIMFAQLTRTPPDKRIFNISRQLVHNMIKRTFKESAIKKPDGVGHVHILRHTGAILFLEKSGDSHALLKKLGHTTFKMMYRYLSTRAELSSLETQKEVDIWE